jgi:hypothetical protein
VFRIVLGGVAFSSSDTRELLIVTELKLKQGVPHFCVSLKIKSAGTTSLKPAIFVVFD